MLEIKKSILDFYKLNSFNEKIIYKIVILIRKTMANYIKETYYGKLAIDNVNENIAIDESLFCHFNGVQKICVIGLININTYEFRLETVLEKNSEIIKKKIKFHVGPGNNIITDGWSA